MKTIKTIFTREYWSFLNSGTGYVVAVAFLLPSIFLFWQTTLVNGEASMRGFFDLWPWFMLLMAPAITMRSLSEEKRKQTLDLLLAYPVREWQIVIGKFLGAWAFLATILAVTGVIPWIMGYYSTIDFGPVFAAYFGALLSGGAFIAIGIAVSAWVDNVISSFLIAAGVSFIWIMLGLDMVSMAIPGDLGVTIQQLGVFSHVDQINRGLINLRDVVFFVMVIGLALLVGVTRIMESKTIEQPMKRTRLYVSMILTIVGMVIVNQLLLAWPIRWDTTRNAEYTLSNGTTQTLGSLDDIVSLTLYTSRRLPPGQVQISQQFVQDLLDDYVKFGHGKIRLSVIYPESDSTLQEKAASEGIRQIQFNTMGSGKFQIEAGYLGIAMAYGGKKESIAYVADPGNLEYELTRRIRKLTRETPRTLGIVSGLGEKQQYSDYQNLAQALQTEYELQSVSLDEPISSTPEALLLVGPSESVSASQSAFLADYIQKGGKAVLLLDQIVPNYDLGIANAKELGWNSLLSAYGMTLNKDMAYDTKLNQLIRIPDGMLSYSVAYPFWMNTVTNKNYSPLGGIESVTLGWASSITINPLEGVETTPLLTTSDDGGVQTENFVIEPKSAPTVSQNKKLTLAALSTKGDSKLAVVADADFALNDFTQYRPANIAFVSNLIDSMIAKEGEASVPSKDFSPALLAFSDPTSVILVEYGTLIGLPLLVALIGIIRLRARRKATGRVWT